MIRAQPFFVIVFAVLGWLMLWVGVGTIMLGVRLLLEGNAWAPLLVLPAAAGSGLGVWAIGLAVQHLAGRGPAGWG